MTNLYYVPIHISEKSGLGGDCDHRMVGFAMDREFKWIAIREGAWFGRHLDSGGIRVLDGLRFGRDLDLTVIVIS